MEIIERSNINELMDYQIFRVDAFVDGLYLGNSAGVCLLPEEKTYDCLRNVSIIMNLSETAFIYIKKKNNYLRWFTCNGTEIDLCGHATLAAAKILWARNYYNLTDTIHFHTKSGLLSAETSGELISIDFPLDTITEFTEDKVGLLLGVKPIFVGKTKFDYLLVVEDEGTVKDLCPNFEKLVTIKTRGIIVTARSMSTKYHYVARFFAPAVGVNEDPVTGSAHCALGIYWSRILGENRLIGYQASREGGIVNVQVFNDRVKLSGKVKEKEISYPIMKQLYYYLAETP
jgi:PhzF family phenazine biosynthesis protein